MSTGVDWPKTLTGWGWTAQAKTPTVAENADIEKVLERLATSEEDISMTIMSAMKTNVQISADGLTIPYRRIFEAGHESFKQHKKVMIVPFSDTKAFAFELPVAIHIAHKNILELRYLKIKINKIDLKKVDTLGDACVSYHCSDNYKGVGLCQN